MKNKQKAAFKAYIAQTFSSLAQALKFRIVSFTIRYDQKLAAKYCRIKGDCWETRPAKGSKKRKA